MYKGIGSSSGIAIGKALVLPELQWDLPDKEIEAADLAEELERLHEGVRLSLGELEYIKSEISDFVGSEESTIFDAHMAILDDPIFINEIQTLIQKDFRAAEVAVKETIDKFTNMFDLLDDDYMKERALDIKDVGNRLLKHLLGKPELSVPAGGEPYILVAGEITPSQIANSDPARLLGLVTMLGGTTSHAAILARAQSIPFVLGLEGVIQQPIQTGDLLIVDGDKGLVYVNPAEAVIEAYEKRKSRWTQLREQLREIVDLQAVTLDGFQLELAANISSAKELDMALRNGAQGVGLFRTEFLYMDRSSLPLEEEQFQVYRQVAERMGHHPIIIRTLDIGGDKQLSYLALPVEENPTLGYRAIRVSLDRTDLFKTQLRAILRASRYGKVKIMYPMISSLEEVRHANLLLDEAKSELAAEGIPFDADIEVGIMIEVPAAAVIADLLAQEVQFFSIGTNDLTQYVLAVDRMNKHIAHLYDSFHPALIRLLKVTVDAAKRNGISIGVCGEMAGDLRALPIWIGLGVQELSMSVQSLLQIKNAILQFRETDCRLLVESVTDCKTSGEIVSLLDEFAANHLKEVNVHGIEGA